MAFTKSNLLSPAEGRAPAASSESIFLEDVSLPAPSLSEESFCLSSSPDQQKMPSLGVLCASAVNKLGNNRRDAEFAENICFAQSGDGDCEDKYIWLAKQSTCNSKPLALSTRKLYTIISDYGI